MVSCKFLWNGIGINPTDVGVLAWLVVFGFAGPLMGDEDHGEEAVAPQGPGRAAAVEGANPQSTPTDAAAPF